jgi:hypothetical protein
MRTPTAGPFLTIPLTATSDLSFKVLCDGNELPIEVLSPTGTSNFEISAYIETKKLLSTTKLDKKSELQFVVIAKSGLKIRQIVLQESIDLSQPTWTIQLAIGTLPNEILNEGLDFIGQICAVNPISDNELACTSPGGILWSETQEATKASFRKGFPLEFIPLQGKDDPIWIIEISDIDPMDLYVPFSSLVRVYVQQDSALANGLQAKIGSNEQILADSVLVEAFLTELIIYLCSNRDLMEEIDKTTTQPATELTKNHWLQHPDSIGYLLLDSALKVTQSGSTLRSFSDTLASDPNEARLRLRKLFMRAK